MDVLPVTSTYQWPGPLSDVILSVTSPLSNVFHTVKTSSQLYRSLSNFVTLRLA